MEKDIFISGMTCSHCSMRVKSALMNIDGIEEANVFLPAGKATIKANKDIDAQMTELIKSTIDDAGYSVIRFE